MEAPPSATSGWPVMNDESLRAKNTTAPTLSGGWLSLTGIHALADRVDVEHVCLHRQAAELRRSGLGAPLVSHRAVAIAPCLPELATGANPTGAQGEAKGPHATRAATAPACRRRAAVRKALRW